MEWNRIEKKWNEMARRLQHTTPDDIAHDAVSNITRKATLAPPAVEKPATDPTAMALAAYATTVPASV